MAKISASANPARTAAWRTGGTAAPTRSDAGVRAAIWACRAAFALVFAVNVHCALSFAVDPASYTGGFELTGVAGEAATRGMGVAFLMWNCTYPLVIWRPARHRALAGVVLAQQVVGLAGETAILAGLPADHAALAGGIMRFVAFDGFGLIVMAAAFAWLLLAERRCRER
jgi:hypothetical protein